MFWHKLYAKNILEEAIKEAKKEIEDREIILSAIKKVNDKLTLDTSYNIWDYPRNKVMLDYGKITRYDKEERVLKIWGEHCGNYLHKLDTSDTLIVIECISNIIDDAIEKYKSSSHKKK